MKNGTLAILLFVALMLVIGGCGYTTSSFVCSDAKSIHVDNFANKINLTEEVTDRRMYIGYRSGMELSITREIIDRFLIDGNLKITQEKEADLILKGALIDFRKEALRFDSADNVIEFRVKVIVDMKLIDKKTGDIILEEKNFTGESIYRTIGSFAKSEDSAIEDAIKDLAVRVVERIVEGW